jgi:hypothetical protein
MSSDWSTLSYEEWSATCDTLHAHTQILGKLAVALAPPEVAWPHGAEAERPRTGGVLAGLSAAELLAVGAAAQVAARSGLRACRTTTSRGLIYEELDS